MSTAELSEELGRNFHILWDNFPFPVMLIRKDRTVLDRNKAAEAVGCTLGTRCADVGTKEDHRGCLANEALREKAGKRTVGYVEMLGRVLDTYWIPLAGHEDLYLHFSSDITEYAAERLLPGSAGQGGNPEPEPCCAEAASCGDSSDSCRSCRVG